MNPHPLISLFQQRRNAGHAGQQSHAGGCHWQSCGLVNACKDKLTEEDLAILGEIGGMLYRDGLRRRE